MFNFFDAIIKYLLIIVDFIVNAIVSLVHMVEMVIKGYAAVSVALAHMPTFLQVFAFAVISYCVVINIINKGG